MPIYKICRFCRYSTTSSSNFLQHRKTQKHRDNLDTYIRENPIYVKAPPNPLTEEQKDLIIEENQQRRRERGPNLLKKFLANCIIK